MKAFITTEFSKDALEKLREILKDDVIYESWRSTKNFYFNDEQYIERIRELGAEIVICEGDNVTSTVIENTDLKIIGSTRDDPNNVDVAAATKRGIPVIYAPKRNSISVAELTVTLILALARKLHQIDRHLHSKDFHVDEFSEYVDCYNRFIGIDLKGKTIGIVGLGTIGFEVARRLKPFGVKFVVFDPYVSESKLKEIEGARVTLENLMSEADFITIHCPPTDETDNLISGEMIELMKPTAYLLNLARASIIDDDALYDALKDGRIAGAALDVFSVEPVDQDNEFLSLENMIVTPHVGGNTVDTNRRHSWIMVDAIEKILNGEIPDNIMNPEVLDPSLAGKKGVRPSFLELRQEIISVCKEMVDRGFIVGTAGNVSVRVRLANGNDRFLITPSTVDYKSMKIEDVVLVDKNGAVIEGTRNPSSEIRLHLAIYQARDDINAIIHSHPPYSTALSVARVPIGPVVDEFIPFVGGCEVARFAMAGTQELADYCVKALKDNYAVLLANHGNVCCGKDLDHAWNICKSVENAAKTQLLSAIYGKIYAIPEDAEGEEREIFELMRDIS
ncbi:MAG: NAD(P)-dependent oxidoreductase [Promethearchaeota archaeon]